METTTVVATIPDDLLKELASDVDEALGALVRKTTRGLIQSLAEELVQARASSNSISELLARLALLIKHHGGTLAISDEQVAAIMNDHRIILSIRRADDNRGTIYEVSELKNN
jgi:hypothetical protein